MAEAQPPPIERVHAICVLCGVDFIVGRAAFENHFEDIDVVLAAIAVGTANFKCGPCASTERQNPALQ